MNVKHIFFDLDHTLWDFDKNSTLAFHQIFKEQHILLEVNSFTDVYRPINLKYWKLYREDKISKSALKFDRLKEVFDAFDYEVNGDFINLISEKYIKYLSNYNYLLEGAVDILEYLSKKYELHIITNGYEEIQKNKLIKSGIEKYFNKIITAESTGVKKPSSKVFEYALMRANTTPKNSVMIGDSYEADVLGALNLGMYAIHFTSESKIEPRVLSVNKLINLKEYL
ncbi:YjjG family noncanonical pyrimidine nucleotidase [Tenacibaculum aestuariivivum]|uniref:YjjG family noncanonical pyrimidine nucleotidase n=1 Tax=Tenacibaculum aestuariivivum TaxID=2006131 RepID=UPI003AB79B4D